MDVSGKYDSAERMAASCSLRIRPPAVFCGRTETKCLEQPQIRFLHCEGKPLKRIVLVSTLLIIACTYLAHADAHGRIVNFQTGLVIGVPGGATNEGVQLIVWHGDGSANQQWLVSATDRGWFKLVNDKSGLCMGVRGGASNDGAQIVQWHDDGSPNQQWRWERRSQGMVLVNRGSRKCVGVAGGSTQEGAKLIQWHEDGSLNQRWNLRN